MTCQHRFMRDARGDVRCVDCGHGALLRQGQAVVANRAQRRMMAKRGSTAPTIRVRPPSEEPVNGTTPSTPVTPPEPEKAIVVQPRRPGLWAWLRAVLGWLLARLTGRRVRE